ncbi:VanZ like family protein [Arboricoccus pini]|uniref:VanZ like family protein n=1 Tax=Arboricoccus pini TaxID=1963835 RepID=A0A212Q3K3_9PROT|nr:VanZ family protein [Arboricoccus pini]SNB53762.1 VanZ like family protein [Arboricoccus pini]
MTWLLDALAMLRQQRQVYRLVLTLLWLAGWGMTAFLMLDPGLTPPGHMNDKVAHALLYTTITAMGATMADRLGRFLAVVFLTWGVSAAFEVTQNWVPGRTADPRDLLANSLGVLFGAGCGLFWLWLCHQADRRPAPARS